MTRGHKSRKWRRRDRTVYYPKTSIALKGAEARVHPIDKEPDKFVVFEKYEIFDEVIKLPQSELMEYVIDFLVGKGYSKEHAFLTKNYAYFDGEIPILLIAHLDTVHASPVTTIYKHLTEGYLIAREGIGGDDRCGVYLILNIVRKNYKPFILLTTDEEIGAVGAHAAAKELTPAPAIKYMVEIDRRGKEDSVYYDNDNKDFKKYIDAFGFKEASGSFSDISVLGDAWNIASVNLSSGYYDAHSVDEKIKINELFATQKKVMKMLDNPPEKKFDHVESVYTWGGWGGYDIDEYYGTRYGDYAGLGRLPATTVLTTEQVDEAAFKGIAVKFLDKAAKALATIKEMPFVKNIYAKDNTGKHPHTEKPFFSTTMDTDTHWIDDINTPKTSKFYITLKPQEKQKVNPAIALLLDMYKQYPNFDAALSRYASDPAKWKAFIVDMHKKKPTVGQITPTQHMSFGRVPLEGQDKILVESLECIFRLKDIPNVQRISIESGKITVGYSDEHFFGTMPIGILATNARFKEKASKKLLDLMKLLDVRVKMYTGLDAALQKEIDDLEVGKSGKKVSKTTQTSLGMSVFEKLNPNVKARLIDIGLDAVDFLEGLPFMKAVSVIDNDVYINFTFEPKKSISTDLGAALKMKSFNDQLDAAYPKLRKESRDAFIELLATLKKYDGYAAALLETRQRRAIPAVKKVEPTLSEKEKKVMANIKKLLVSQEDVDDFMQIWEDSGEDYELALERYTIFLEEEKELGVVDERMFDDAPACSKRASRDIVDRFETAEPSEKNLEEDFEDMDVDEAIYTLEGYFNDYSFMIDPEGDDCESFFVDSEGIERPIKDLKTEIDSIARKKTRKTLRDALNSLLIALRR